MNSHSEIRKRLAAYCSGDVSSGERAEIEAHLLTCLRCRTDLADLRTTLKLIRSVPEVEAPGWMKSRIMAHLREEQTTKRSWLQWFRFPLQTGFPVKAMALLIVCISGYYLSRSVDTQLQLAKQQQLQEIPAQQAPPAASTPAPVPAQAPAEREKAGRPAPQQPQKTTAPASAPQPAPRPENLSAPLAPQLQSAPAPGGYAPPPPALKDQFGGKAESTKAAPAAEPANRAQEAAPEMKQIKKSRSLERSSDSAAPAAAGRAAGAPAGPQAVLRLSVNDPATAPALIREAVARSGGRITEEQGPAVRHLTIRIPATQQAELLERLQLLGRVVERPAAAPSGAQLLELTIQW